MWPRGRLPQHALTARVIIYGYHSGLKRGIGFTHLGDLAGSLCYTGDRIPQYYWSICRLFCPHQSIVRVKYLRSLAWTL